MRPERAFAAPRADPSLWACAQLYGCGEYGWRDSGLLRPCPVWEDLAEICSLVVREDARRLGTGRDLVNACLSECRDLHIQKVFALTYQEAFFARLGFRVVDKDVLPQKIWADCVHCAKYPNCDETAVYFELDSAAKDVGEVHVQG